MNLKKVKHLMYALCAALLLQILLMAIFPSLILLWLALFFVFGVAGVAVSLRWWRCPNCGEHLGRGIPKYCPNCGHRLDELL